MSDVAIHLGLLGGFRLTDGDVELHVPPATRRVLAVLALRDRPTRRSHLAGLLWPDKTDGRAQANLRAALWRLGQIRPGVVTRSADSLSLDAGVGSDIRTFWSWSERLMSGRARLDDLTVTAARQSWELLPDWYDEWVDVERERIRQRWLHAIEALARELTRLRRFGQAVDVSLTAVAVDPLRESAHRAVMVAHLGEDNVGEARRQFDRCCQTLQAELGIAPSTDLSALVDPPHNLFEEAAS